MEASASGNSRLEAEVEELHKQLNNKRTFQNAVSALTSILCDHRNPFSESERRKVYSAICRAATLLRSRYTGRAFWDAGLKLLNEAEHVFNQPHEKKQLGEYKIMAYDFLGEETQLEESLLQVRPTTDGRFLFDGQLTVGAEPSPPAWLLAQNALTALSANEESRRAIEEQQPVASETEDATTSSTIQNEAIQEIMQRMLALEEYGSGLEEAIQATLQEVANAPHGPPPASKVEVKKLPVTMMTDEVLKTLGEGSQCAVCREELLAGDATQKMPCAHLFHPECLKPWLDQHNSCPICRFEMLTDDHEYESKKEREREAEEERKGSANAVRGGEFMYI
ncbi:hypothetical protein O6H91_19G039800 [Diphasiastrum complanatum]|uniref:Uncharacterized protein n=1 Tax=Diphasiastrum complanatum TaxID=34168 RepID=A0ACC2AUD7_DIPCM|nr:hypothetical protein O6H91_19G039800 [Diphasiastrum complanatum]